MIFSDNFHFVTRNRQPSKTAFVTAYLCYCNFGILNNFTVLFILLKIAIPANFWKTDEKEILGTTRVAFNDNRSSFLEGIISNCL